MGNTITKGRFSLQVLFDTSADWDAADDYPNGLSVESLEMIPTATDDAILVKEVDTSGPAYMNALAATKYDNKIKYFNTEKSEKNLFLFVDKDDVSSGVILLITLK